MIVGLKGKLSGFQLRLRSAVLSDVGSRLLRPSRYFSTLDSEWIVLSRPLRSSVTDLAAPAVFQTPVRRLGGSRSQSHSRFVLSLTAFPRAFPNEKTTEAGGRLGHPTSLVKASGTVWDRSSVRGGRGGSAPRRANQHTRLSKERAKREAAEGRRQRRGALSKVLKQRRTRDCHQAHGEVSPSQLQAQKGKRRIEANKAFSERVPFPCATLGGQPVQSVGEASMEQEKYLPELMAEKDSLDPSFVHAMRLLAEGKSWLSSLRVWRIFVGGLLVAIPSAEVPCCHRCCVLRFGAGYTEMG